VDAYLANLEEPRRSTLETLRRTILEVAPKADQALSHHVPAFTIRGKVIAGFGGYKYHLSYFPYSGSVITELQDELTSYSIHFWELRFPIDEPLPRSIVEKLIDARLAEAVPG
jgi:uncharacterized protein YdhG (YjbR/CyaY superfamily)